MEASREALTETVIEYAKQRLVFSKPLAVQVHCDKGKLTLESTIGISGSGSDFESAWKSFRVEIFRRWNDPVMRGKQFPSGTVDREETVKSAGDLEEAANHEKVREVA